MVLHSNIKFLGLYLPWGQEFYARTNRKQMTSHRSLESHDISKFGVSRILNQRGKLWCIKGWPVDLEVGFMSPDVL
jgi:hypothetical protein